MDKPDKKVRFAFTKDSINSCVTGICSTAFRYWYYTRINETWLYHYVLTVVHFDESDFSGAFLVSLESIAYDKFILFSFASLLFDISIFLLCSHTIFIVLNRYLLFYIIPYLSQTSYWQITKTSLSHIVNSQRKNWHYIANIKANNIQLFKRIQNGDVHYNFDSNNNLLALTNGNSTLFLYFDSDRTPHVICSQWHRVLLHQKPAVRNVVKIVNRSGTVISNYAHYVPSEILSIMESQQKCFNLLSSIHNQSS